MSTMADNQVSPNTTKYDYLFKLVLVGNMGVGKSSLMLRFADNNFFESTYTTIGVDFKIKTVLIEGKVVKLQIWDTAGQERYRSFSTNFFRGAHGIILVYSVTDKNSFDDIPSWIQVIKDKADPSVVSLLIGNKTDMSEQRVVGERTGRDIADRLGMSYLETSAKNSTNVDQAFISMATMIKNNIGSAFPVVDNMADSFRLESTPVSETYCCSYL